MKGVANTTAIRHKKTIMRLGGTSGVNVMTRKYKKDGSSSSRIDSPSYMQQKSLLESFLAQGCRDYPDELDEILKDTARSGIIRMPWDLLRPALLHKLGRVLTESFLGPHAEDDNKPKQLKELLQQFKAAPFTIQRICELLVEPTKHYNKRDKYMRAMEKNLLVVSTQEPDLTWMKVPVLAQLLHVDSQRSLVSSESTPSNSPDPILEKMPAMMELDKSCSLWHTRTTRPTRSSTPPASFEAAKGNDVFNLEERIRTSLLAGRKRSWHSTDATDLHVQLQEADSTVTDPSQSEDQERKEKERTEPDSPEQEDRKRRRGMAESDDKDLPSLSDKNEQALSNSGDEKMKDTDSVPQETKGTDSRPKTEPTEHQSMQCEEDSCCCESVHPVDEVEVKEGVVSLGPMEHNQQQEQHVGKDGCTPLETQALCPQKKHREESSAEEEMMDTE